MNPLRVTTQFGFLDVYCVQQVPGRDACHTEERKPESTAMEGKK
jgi:hypothetical protein